MAKKAKAAAKVAGVDEIGSGEAGAAGKLAGADKEAAAKKVADNKPEKYKMKEKLVALGDDFWIETENGNKPFKINGKLMSVRDKLSFEDNREHELAYIESKFFTVRDRLNIERIGGPNAQLRKDFVNVVHDAYILDFDDGESLNVSGNFLDHEYDFKRGREKVAEVSKRWFRVADTYGVHIEAGEDHIMILAACVALDQGSHDVGPVDV